MNAGQNFALGTAQFGSNYGIANKKGKIEPNELRVLIKSAFSFGINTIDTAVSYGDCEKRLGEIDVGGCNVVSKLPSIKNKGNMSVDKWVQEVVRGSLGRLKIHRLYGLLLHYPIDLIERDGRQLIRALNDLKKNNLCEKIGVSVYSPEELDLIDPVFEYDLVQIPLNILNRSMLLSGWINRLHKKNIEIHSRSAFLQGLLLMGKEKRPNYFMKWEKIWSNWESWLELENLNPLTACLQFMLQQTEIDKIVIGVDSVDQLKEIMSVRYNPLIKIPDNLVSSDPKLINPNLWNNYGG